MGDYGYEPLPYQGEGEINYVATMPYATTYTGEAALQYEPVEYQPELPSFFPSSGTTDWRFRADGGDADIETMREWLTGMDSGPMHKHAEAWRRAGTLLTDAAATLRTRAAALQAGWRSPDASAAFLERVGATLYSLDSWAVVAGNNAQGLEMIAGAVSSAKADIEPLYEEYQRAQADEARARERDRGFQLTDLNDPVSGNEEVRSEEEVSREYHERAVPIVKPVADAYVDAQFWWMDQGRRFAGPLDFQAGTGAGPAAGGGGGGVAPTPTIAGGPSVLPPWAPSAASPLSPTPGGTAGSTPVPDVSGGGHLAGAAPPAVAPAPAAPAPVGPSPVGPPVGGPTPGLPPILRPPATPPGTQPARPPAARPPVLRPPATPAGRPPAARPPTTPGGSSVIRPPATPAGRPPAARPPAAPGSSSVIRPPAARPPGAGSPGARPPGTGAPGAGSPGARPPGAGSPGPRSGGGPSTAIPPGRPGGPSAASPPPPRLAPGRTPPGGVARPGLSAPTGPAPALPGATARPPAGSPGPAASGPRIAGSAATRATREGGAAVAPGPARARGKRNRDDENPKTVDGERDDSLWTTDVPSGVVEAPPERPPAEQSGVITPETR